MTKGMIFDIKRFAIHDGKGIRTTIFFKGCPLKCLWCHNPEGFSIKKQLSYQSQSCFQCGNCIDNCPMKSIEFKNNEINILANCDSCGSCIEYCPSDALKLIGRCISVSELLDEIEKDRVFYSTSDGGITISGGEPFFQIDFLLAVLQACKKVGLQTAVETSFYCDYQDVEKVIPYVDQFIIDIKLFDEKMHEHYTGKTNKEILDNIRKLANTKTNILLRTPLIPKITDTKENLCSIRKFIRSLSREIEHELLDYNFLAPAKYAMLQKEYKLEKL